MTEHSPELAKLVAAGRAATRPKHDDYERIRLALEARLDMPLPPSPVPNRLPFSRRFLSSPYAKTAATALAGALGLLGYAMWPVSPPLKEAESGRTIGTLVRPTHVQQSPPRVTDAVEPAPVPMPQATSAAIPFNAAKTSSALPARDGLSEEVTLLSRAERELYRGNAAQALNTLSEHERRFPHGALSEERTAAKIHALCALGRSDEATALLTRLKAGSLHGQSARDACTTTGKGQTSDKK